MVTTNARQTNAAVLSIRLLALFDKNPDQASQEYVHRLRTTVRRLEVQLGVCPPKVSASLKALRKKAGKVRDIDVHLALLKPAIFLRTSARSNGSNVTPGPRQKLRESLRNDLRERLRKILKAKRDRHLGSLCDAVAEVAPLLQAKLPLLAERATQSTGAHSLHRHIARARNGYLQWTRNVPEDAEPLHRLRTHTKKLRYSLEPFAENPEAAELATQLKRVQEAIGTWHDWATLEQLAERELTSSDADAACAMLRARTGREYRKARRTALSVRTWMLANIPAASAIGDNESQQLTRKAG